MILLLLRAWGRRRPYFDIYLYTNLYMRRWWLIGGSHPQRDPDADRPRWAPRTWVRGRLDAWLGRRCAVRLHHIVRADMAADHHTHPFTFCSVIVRGWYVERRPADPDQPAALDATHYTERRRGPGSVGLLRAADRHTITAVDPAGCWTVFAMGRKRGTWGFWTPSGFVGWRDYEGDR